ncbi:hypothetical protein SARC_07910 [Sphaeroforma arctica JP610]|uniref:G domain-containing protein n=1 Tax=Sphaeroforma arctica JP610 TaxID=667725 RepID=A0A0L0FSN8_9EUKA|nr:hypothetical protein SARC_07910 [Sphaeroforma arctica JP610]KNC79699.1 hypothetical protein SARC_07910 [Sphaeroforma arctica JP610]|eukprot:XP_014153601.1 hypothetical protein SARC_07910 [Sphaeroforma arctica JP610]
MSVRMCLARPCRVSMVTGSWGLKQPTHTMNRHCGTKAPKSLLRSHNRSLVSRRAGLSHASALPYLSAHTHTLACTRTAPQCMHIVQRVVCRSHNFGSLFGNDFDPNFDIDKKRREFKEKEMETRARLTLRGREGVIAAARDREAAYMREKREKDMRIRKVRGDFDVTNRDARATRNRDGIGANEDFVDANRVVIGESRKNSRMRDIVSEQRAREANKTPEHNTDARTTHAHRRIHPERRGKALDGGTSAVDSNRSRSIPGTSEEGGRNSTVVPGSPHRRRHDVDLAYERAAQQGMHQDAAGLDRTSADNAIHSSDTGNTVSRGVKALKSGRPLTVVKYNERGERFSPEIELRERFMVAGVAEEAGNICHGCGGIIAFRPEEGVTSKIIKSTRVARFYRMGLCLRCRTLIADKQAKGGPREAVKKARQRDQLAGSVADVRRHALPQDRAHVAVFEKEVAVIAKELRAYVLLVVDATDFEGSLIRNLRTYIDRHPVILVVTKCDLLPFDISDETQGRHLREYFQSRMQERGTRVAYEETFLLSGKRDSGINNLVQCIRDNLMGRNVYVMGNANVGKSTLVNAFAQRMLNINLFVGEEAHRKERVQWSLSTTSHLAGTTLMTTRIPCFHSHKHALFDTPGLFPRTYQWDIPPILPTMLEPQILPWPRSSEHNAHVPPNVCGTDTVSGVEVGKLQCEVGEPHHRPPAGSVRVRVPGLPLSIDIHLPDRKITEEPTMVWYSPVSVQAEAISIAGTSRHSDVDTQKDGTGTYEYVTDDSVIVDLSHAKVQNFQLLSPDAQDMVVLGLGWVALQVPAGSRVQVSAPPASEIVHRDAMFSPSVAQAQLDFVAMIRDSYRGGDWRTRKGRQWVGPDNTADAGELSNPFMPKDEKLTYIPKFRPKTVSARR